MIIDGVAFEDDGLEFFDSGRVREGTLAKDALIAGLPCASGRDIDFYPGGNPRLLFLSEPTEVRGVCCARGLLYLHDNGRVWNCSLGSDLRASSLALRTDTRVTLDDRGDVLEYWTILESDTELQGIPCCADFPVWRYAAGQISCCVLSRSHQIGSLTHTRWTELLLDESGEVMDAVRLHVESGKKYKHRIYGAVKVTWA